LIQSLFLIVPNTSLNGDKILGESLQNINVNLVDVNNVSLTQIANKLVELDFKINTINYQIASLIANKLLDLATI